MVLYEFMDSVLHCCLTHHSTKEASMTAETIIASATVRYNDNALKATNFIALSSNNKVSHH